MQTIADELMTRPIAGPTPLAIPTRRQDEREHDVHQQAAERRHDERRLERLAGALRRARRGIDGSRSRRRMKRSAERALGRRGCERRRRAPSRWVVSSPVAMRDADARRRVPDAVHRGRPIASGVRRSRAPTTSAGVAARRRRRRRAVSSARAAVAPQHADGVDAVDRGAVDVVVAVADHHDVGAGRRCRARARAWVMTSSLVRRPGS